MTKNYPTQLASSEVNDQEASNQYSAMNNNVLSSGSRSTETSPLKN